jgi:release factor glutamine methyltransferase
MERARKLCRRLFHHLYHAHALRQIAKPTTRLCGHTLLTDPEVFHPVHFLSTRVFLDYLGTLDLAGQRFLDMGTGSGAIGILAASRGAVVTSCDVNPHAVRLATENARRNELPIEVLESNLFSALSGRRFDVIGFNLPFYAKQPRTPFEAALYAGDNLETIAGFASGCREALAPGGSVVVIFSEDSGRERVLSLFTAAGLRATDERTTTRFFERFHVLRFRQAAAGAPPAEHRR